MSSTSSGQSVYELSPDAAAYLINHVFLPPKLPQEDDYQPHLDIALLQSTISALSAFRDCVSNDRHASINAAIKMFLNMRKVHFDGDVNEKELLKALKNVTSDGM